MTLADARGGAALTLQQRAVHDPAVTGAPPPNGRSSVQTVRLNQPLLHVQLIVEGRDPIRPEWLTLLFDTMSPDVFEDSPTITCLPVLDWPEDEEGLVLASLAHRRVDYLGPGYDIRTRLRPGPRRRGALGHRQTTCHLSHPDAGRRASTAARSAAARSGAAAIQPSPYLAGRASPRQVPLHVVRAPPASDRRSAEAA